MENNDRKKRIALFRFGVISPLVGVKQTERGQKEKLIREITAKVWEIPDSGRSSIMRGTVLTWLRKYEKSGGNIESLMPKTRDDMGRARKMDRETELALVNLRREPDNRKVSLSIFLSRAREKNILQPNFSMSSAAVYRILRKHLGREESRESNRLKFEAELPNDLWQCDAMHGPVVNHGGKLRKSYLFAIIDDHSRLIPHAEFYVHENIDSFIACLRKSLAKRGLPRKLYTDNGPCFRSARLAYSLASLGVSLLHAKPYTPEGKGKIERWFRTVRSGFLPEVPHSVSLEELNTRLQQWIDGHYHVTNHSGTKRKPLDRYLAGLQMIRKAPTDLDTHFRTIQDRVVTRDRVISLNGRKFEAPATLIGKKVRLLYDAQTPGKVEVFFNDQSYGMLTRLNPQVNCGIRRTSESPDRENQELEEPQVEPDIFRNGELF